MDHSASVIPPLVCGPESDHMKHSLSGLKEKEAPKPGFYSSTYKLYSFLNACAFTWPIDTFSV